MLKIRVITSKDGQMLKSVLLKFVLFSNSSNSAGSFLAARGKCNWKLSSFLCLIMLSY